MQGDKCGWKWNKSRGAVRDSEAHPRYLYANQKPVDVLPSIAVERKSHISPWASSLHTLHLHNRLCVKGWKYSKWVGRHKMKNTFTVRLNYWDNIGSFQGKRDYLEFICLLISISSARTGTEYPISSCTDFSWITYQRITKNKTISYLALLYSWSVLMIITSITDEKDCTSVEIII